MVGQEGMVWSDATRRRRVAAREQWRRTAAELGRALRHERRMAGLSQVELAEALGITQATISTLERGDGTPRSSLRWYGLADAALLAIIASQEGGHAALNVPPVADSLTAGA